MWFLEHETLFEGKRVWLRPGSQQLFGRTKPADGDLSEGKKVFIDNKNVSRKHMMIRVLEVPPEDGTKLQKRSQVEVVDLSCRQGTWVDGQSIKSTKTADGGITYDKTTLTEKEHTIKLSNSYPPFKIQWQDVIITNTSKEKRADATSATRTTQLHAMDIKTSTEVVYGKTTHIVSQKRNLPKVLQGLVAGIPIVTTDFLDAVLSAAAHSVDADDNYVPSQLEEDFDASWPREKDYIPPAGAEPVARPEHMLEPDPSRSEVFLGLTFVFFDEVQHTNLHQVVAGGGGKALLFDIRPGETTVEEYVEYVNHVAGQKKRAKTSNGSLPVVTIRLGAYPDQLADWSTDFVARVDQSLNQRSILQNEFLDAIVTKDSSQLRRPPTEMVADSSIAPPMPSQRPKQGTTPVATQIRVPLRAPEADAAPEEPVKTITRKRPVRKGITSRFTGFDDYEPPTKVQKVEDTPVPMEDVQESTEPPSQPVPAIQTRTLRNTRLQSVDPTEPVKQERTKQMDQLFPAAAAIKRQRGATRAHSTSVEPETGPQTQKPKRNAAEILEKLQNTKKKATKEINVREQTRKHVEEQEEKRRLEEEGLREALEGVDISEIRANIQVEEMKMRPREEQGNRANTRQVKSDGWDPAWDGRKNFKKFRRRGTEGAPQSQRVLVSFEEAPQKKSVAEVEMDMSVGTDHERKSKRRQDRAADSESEAEQGFRRRKKAKNTEVIHVEDSGPDDEDPVVGTRGSGRTQRVAETQLEDTQMHGKGKKRGPVTVAAGPAKKGRYSKKDDSDSDAEETGFRFKRRA
ncbi:hypothetical protein P280DRAFT_281381 [Massarina eburnea CBS 473.64]|uniref:FHA domain-containing protein n=1 Tax=Massarina eburnea CBS 473.64 TaxID=1395130 RepID=A0A6A6S2U8_9PLEO|nr:hypothetical protein P280DRAFT_281381 [Massarina eburnea CBS 473.64]